MDHLTLTDLKQFLRHPGKPCVSLYQPTTPGGAEQDPILWKNLLADADNCLQSLGLYPLQARGVLAPAAALLEDRSFWKQAGAGLACFLAPGLHRILRLAKPAGPRVHVSNLFMIKPLLPLLAAEQNFLVLALSQKSVKLWRGNSLDLHPVDVKTLPRDLADALKFHDRDEPLMYHTRRTGGTWSAIYHGQGVGIDTFKDDLLLYFQQIDRGLHELLREEKTPLIVASVEYLLPIYRQANTYPHLLAEGIAGSPDHMKPRDLHAKAWKLAAPFAQLPQQRALALFDRLHDTGRTCTAASEVLTAACQGQLETLFVAADAVCWGAVDPTHHTVESHTEPQPGDEDMLNVAAVRMLMGKGAVYVLPAAEIPGGHTQAGIAWLPMDKHGKRRGVRTGA